MVRRASSCSFDSVDDDGVVVVGVSEENVMSMVLDFADGCEACVNGKEEEDGDNLCQEWDGTNAVADSR